MKRVTGLFFAVLIMLFAVAAVFPNTGDCAEKDRVDRLEKTQKEILNRLDALEKRQNEIMKALAPQRPSVDLDKVQNIPDGNSPVRGRKDAPVTIVEFSDFQCPYCSRLQSTLEEVLKAYPKEARLIFKDFPLPFHKFAMRAAIAAHAAGEQGRYWEMHDLIFKNFNMLAEDSFEKFAAELKLDSAKFLADFKSGKYDKQIAEDINLARTIGVGGTPTLFINGKRMQGRSFEDFKAAIESYVKK